MNKGQPKLDQDIFLDRTHGGRMTAMLRRAGLAIRPICEIYPDNAHKFVADPDWIRVCGENNWVIVSGDKRLETVPENRQAIIEARVKVFLLTDSNSFPEVWAAAVIVGRYRMQEIIDANPGPFFVNITKRSDKHIDRLRLPYGFSRPPLELTVVESDSPPLALPSTTSEEAEETDRNVSFEAPLQGLLL